MIDPKVRTICNPDICILFDIEVKIVVLSIAFEAWIPSRATLECKAAHEFPVEDPIREKIRYPVDFPFSGNK